jgi:lipopolysaccharide export system permease protein
MKLIDRHILRNFLIPFVYILVTLLGLFLVYDISSKTARFLKHQVPILTIISFYSLYVPQLIALGLPMVTLLAVVLGVGRMSKNNEITAMRACGVSLLRIASPLFVVGLLLTGLSFFLFEKVVTRTYGETKRFEEALKGRKVGRDVIESGYLPTDEKGSRLGFVRFFPKQKRFEDISWQTEMDNPKGKVTITAREAQWIEDSWWAFGANVKFPDGRHRWGYSKMRMYEWDFRPEEVTGERLDGEMSFAELQKNIRRYGATPQKVKRLEVELHRRMALPVLNLLVVAVALPFGLKGGKRGGSVAVGVGISMLLCVAYYGLSVLLSLFNQWPPWLTVWLPNVLFGLGGGIATIRMR